MLEHIKTSAFLGRDLDGPDRAYTSRVARTISWTLLVAALIVFTAHLMEGPNFVLWPLGAATSLLMVAMVALYNGHLLPVAIASPSFLLLLMAYFCFAGNGIHDVSLIGFPVVVVLAGLLLGRAATVVFGLACAAVLAGLYFAETYGLIVTPYRDATDPVDVVSTSALLGVAVILLYLLIGRLSASLARARRQERALAKSYRQLEGRHDELERFNYTISHDLRSPLITIRGFLGYVEQNAAQGNLDRLRSDLRRIEAATDRMDRLLRDLLELSRLGTLSDNPAELLFEDIARSAVKLLAGPIEKRGVQVTLAPDLPLVQGDRFRLMEVLQNLIENSIKFMGDQANPQIEIGARARGEETVCWVRDNGMGIEPKYHDRIFDLFTTLDPALEGTGIGLPLAKRIIELHGGRIEVESEGEGKGTTVWFTLPHRPIEERAAEIREAAVA